MTDRREIRCLSKYHFENKRFAFKENGKSAENLLLIN